MWYPAAAFLLNPIAVWALILREGLWYAFPRVISCLCSFSSCLGLFAVLNGALCDLIHLWLFEVVFVLPGHAQFLQVLVKINKGGKKAFKTSIVTNC